MKISIFGCGWFGLPLASLLADRGHLVMGSTTTESKLEQLKAKNIQPFLLDARVHDVEEARFASFFDCDVFVITLPPGYGPGYTTTIQRMVRAAGKMGKTRIVYTSSTSVYGSPNAVVDEDSPAAPATPSARSVLEAEHIVRSHAGAGGICIRFGGLIGHDRIPGSHFKKDAETPDGLSPVNLIHLEDCLGISTRLIEGPHPNLTVNAVCPHHPTRMEFYTAAALACNRHAPAFVKERQAWKIVESRVAGPLLDYTFKVDNWFTWLNSVSLV